MSHSTVPDWHFEDQNSSQSKLELHPHTSSSNSFLTDVPLVEYEVAELTWENGQPSMHGLGMPRVVNKPSSPAAWEKPRSGGTLESIVNQAKCLPQPKFAAGDNTEKLVHGTAVKPAATVLMDAVVPYVLDDNQERSALMGINSGCRSESDTRGGRESQHVISCGRQFGGTSTENTTSAGQDYTNTCADHHNDSISHSKSQAVSCTQQILDPCTRHVSRKKGDVEGKRKLSIGQSSISTKRSMAAATHNQSERKRRDKINQRMKTLQKMVPNSSKTDKVSMLDEAIEYMKQLKAQVNMSSMTLSLVHQQLQMSLMGMGMGTGAMDMNAINRAAATSVPPVGPVMPDPLAANLACQSQPTTMDAYSRPATMYQQMQQPPA